jgi:hypothetical protein
LHKLANPRLDIYSVANRVLSPAFDDGCLVNVDVFDRRVFEILA